MKLTGEVFIPRGFYRINNFINVTCGITLTGEPGVFDNPDYNATILVPASGGSFINGSSANKFFVRINVQANNDDGWVVAFPSLETTIKHIRFMNEVQLIPDLNCILALGGFLIDMCTWSEFEQAVQTSYLHYSDSKKVTGCTYWGKQTTPSSLYAFDLKGLGDALIFEHNSVGGQPTLRLSACNNGSVISNILNGNVRIEGCKAIVFHSNHMEIGAQLNIDDSNVTSMNNFFQKGTKPSLIVQSTNDGHVPVVKSSGDMFLFYDKRMSDTSTYDIDAISEYDVQIYSRCSLEFSQTYRYWVLSSAITIMYPFGIRICKDTQVVDPNTEEEIFEPLTEFNNQSYLLSSAGRIMPGYHVVNSAYANNLQGPSSYGYNYHDYCKWHEETGNYYYKYQILWDKKRRIVGNYGNFNWSSGAFIPLTKNNDGILINLANSSTGNGNQLMLRLYRSTNVNFPVGSSTKYIDIPIAGAVYMYDNGISICGFKWKELTNEENIITTNANLNITSIRYNGVNIECKAPTVPSYGIWQEGDIVYNTSTSTTTSHWIYLSGAWRAK
jgi:hypothetical protein